MRSTMLSTNAQPIGKADIDRDGGVGRAQHMIHLKRKIIEVSTACNEGHIPAAFSILDILWVLYDRVLGITPKTLDDPDRNRFILSKGHAAIGLYVVLVEKGIMDSLHLGRFGKFDSILGGHPDRTKVPGIEASTGSLGHGFPIAAGLAFGAKIKKTSSKVYAIVGDGECNEGTIWETAMFAAHRELDNLYCIVDQNHSGDIALRPGDIRRKFESFGWHAVSIDGHDQEKIYDALTQHVPSKPIAVIAETIKGKGCKIMENNPEWTHKYPKPEELEALLQTLR
jgi:transketolase